MASVTHMGVAATDHVVLYSFRSIADGCVQAGYEFFRANVGGLGSAPNPDVDPPFRVREATGGRHIAVTVQPTVETPQQVLAIYRRLRGLVGLVLLW